MNKFQFYLPLSFLLSLFLLNTTSQVQAQQIGLHVDDEHRVLFGESLNGPGPRFMWIPDKLAFRVGLLESPFETYWNIDKLGYGSVAFGFSNLAEGNYSMSWGFVNKSLGEYSTSWGSENDINGNYSTAWGRENKSTSYGSTTWGRGNRSQCLFQTTLGIYADTITHANPTTWETNDLLFAIGNGSDNDNRNNAISLLKNGNLGLNKTEPETLFDVEGTGGDIGGSSGFDEVTAHFKQTSAGHSAVSVDAIDSRDAIVYLAEDGRAYWDLRHDSDDDHQFQIRYQGPGAPNNVRMFMDTLGNMEIDGSLTQMSDRNQKEAFQEMDPQYILDKLQEIPVTEWQYKGDNKRHIGPMAQDFHAAFGLGKDETRISTIDMDGVNMAAIQALYDQNKKQEAEIEKLNEKVLLIEKINKDMKKDMNQMKHQLISLQEAIINKL